MIDKLRSIVSRYNELAELMSQPDAMQDMKTFTNLAREHSRLTELVEEAKNYIETYERLQEDEQILNGDDPELKEFTFENWKTGLKWMRSNLENNFETDEWEF